MPILGSSASQSGRTPGVPTSVSATAGDAQAVVSFTAPAYTGKGTVSYTATSSPGGLTASGASSPLTVTGLTNGTTYTFTVTAANAAATSVASTASTSVTTSAPPAPTPVGPSAPAPEPEPPLGVEWLGTLTDYMGVQEFQLTGAAALLTLVTSMIFLPLIIKKRKRLARIMNARKNRTNSQMTAQDLEDFFD